METGLVENGPALRKLSAFPIDIDRENDMLSAFIPFGSIPPYGKNTILPVDENSTETFVIIGDTLTTLGAITALRTTFQGRIIVIPNSHDKSGFVNTKVLRESLNPCSIKDQYIVDSDFLDKNYCEVNGKKIFHKKLFAYIVNKFHNYRAFNRRYYPN